MTNNGQARKYLLTLNNPDSYGFTREKIIEILQTQISLTYYCVCDEISSTGTPHTHIFAYSESPIRFSTMKNRFPIAHIERAYGSVHSNRDYILKQGKWAETEKAETSVPNSFYEYGEIPTEEKTQLAKVIKAIENGMTTAEIIRQYPKYSFRTNDINTLRSTLLSEKYMKENRELEITYLFGKTGTGKTSSLYKKYDAVNICRITNYNANGIKFDQYSNQDVLVFEEFRSQIPIADMLSYLDTYPLMLPARYSDKVACYTKVYLLSNIPLNMQYQAAQEYEVATWNAFVRRINYVIEQIDYNTQIEHSKESYYRKEPSNPWRK